MNAVQARSGPWGRVPPRRGADAAARDACGFTALHRAAEMGEAELVTRLLAAGASRDAAAAEGHTPLSLARARGHAGIVALLGGG